MFPYLAMLAVPSSLALTGARRAGFMLLAVGLLYWLMIGFRFHVGMDWNNYLFIYEWEKHESFTTRLFGREPGYGLLSWVAANIGGGIIFINAVAGLVFCWGFFGVARRCPEPWLAIAIATPLLAVVFGMSGARQSIACGVIFHLFANWERRNSLARIGLVLLASMFHFSAVFVLGFVALASNAPSIVKVATTVVMVLIVFVVIRFAPQSMEAYSRLYVGMQSKLSAPGAVVQVGAIAAAGAAYLLYRRHWESVFGDQPLVRWLAWGSVACVPAILISSVGAYRFALYFWPMAMYVYSGFPSLIRAATGRAFYRFTLVSAAFAMLIAWLMFANNSLPWLPYDNWWLQPDGANLISFRNYRRI